MFIFEWWKRRKAKDWLRNHGYCPIHTIKRRVAERWLPSMWRYCDPWLPCDICQAEKNARKSRECAEAIRLVGERIIR